MDIDVELDLATLGLEGRRQLAKSAATFGLHPTDFVQLLSADQQLETELRLAKALEEEKLQLAGRKSRRARRLLKERRAKEKFPKLLTTKVGLLNGQPISRRTVYLSASSSDSGDYPSGEEDVVDDRHARGSKAAADVRARRARAKPLLTTARGPSVMIGGMTSISLCRRRNRGLDHNEKMRKTNACSSTSSRSRSGSSSSETRSRRRSSSGLSDSSISVRHSHRGSSRNRGKRPRVEYITTFGDNDDDSSKKHAANSPAGLSWKTSKPPGTAASAVAASVVSKLLSSTSATNKTYSPFPNKSLSDMLRAPVASNSFASFNYRRGVANRSFSPEDHRRNQRRSPSSRRRGYRSRSRSTSPGRRHIGPWNNGRRRERRSHSTTGSESSRSSSKGKWSTKHDYRSSSNRHRSNSSRKSHSRSPLSQRVSVATLPIASSKREGSEYSESRPHVSEVGGTNPSSGDRSSPPLVRKRYYRPELESDEDSRLSEDDDEEDDDQQSNRRYSRSSGRQQDSPSARQTTATTGSWDSSGKMATSATTEAASYHIASKNAPGSAPPGASRPTPQELLKRRVQLQLTKAFNADKKAELEKQVQLEQERLAREEGLRRQARLLRRQEEKRLREERRAAMLASGKPDGSISDTSSSSSDSKTDLCANSRSQLSVPPSARHSPFPKKSSPSSLSLARRNEHRRSRSVSPSRTSRLPSPPSSTGSRSTPSAMRGQKYLPLDYRRMPHLSADYDRFPPSGSRDRFVNRSTRPESERCPPANHYRPSMSSRGTSHWRSNERSGPSPMHQNSSWSSAYPRSNRPSYRARERYS
ncbi:CLK4-associating serine/arginine rich protein [Paragonimus westermani]|uniref:CLK4-associating serine/arginine rich protein n=1 Tax=Paragonimus westermani TaxID=34504 RepID=A0A8T0D672_9TREM|nr:CLK4-associating serine/arginine rich protein [Paragonimus westermani]